MLSKSTSYARHLRLGLRGRDAGFQSPDDPHPVVSAIFAQLLDRHRSINLGIGDALDLRKTKFLGHDPDDREFLAVECKNLSKTCLASTGTGSPSPEPITDHNYVVTAPGIDGSKPTAIKRDPDKWDLFIAEGDEWVDAGGATRGEVAGEDRHNEQQCANAKQCERVVGFDAKKHRAKVARDGERSGSADGSAHQSKD